MLGKWARADAEGEVVVKRTIAITSWRVTERAS